MAQKTLRDYLQTTEDAISSGSITDALSNCQYILTHFPDSLEAQRLLGEVYLAQGYLDEAQQTFDWILTNDPENVIVYCDRALISEQMSDFDTALDCYQQAYELSRGNSQIRQEFNQLSMKIGQQGFIFSRAGLARLYMRGDLLSKAIQEWETVLSISPERLDARIGLLETYWREGLFDRAEQLATHILRDVPGCLKALLLLAHMIYTQNTQLAQELLERAATLDPEMIMAQELFSDLMAGQAHDPFLALVKQPPIVFPELSNGPLTAPNIATVSANGTLNNTSFSDPLLSWDSLDTLIEPQQAHPPLPEVSPFETLSSNSTSDLNAWSVPDQQPYQTTQQTTPPSPSSESVLHQTADAELQTEPELEPEIQPTQQVFQDGSDGAKTDDQALLTEQPWYTMDQFAEFNAQSVEPWSSAINSANPAPAWELETLEVDVPSPPAWLDMLTKDERRPSSGPLPIQPPQVEQEALAIPPAQETEKPVFEAALPLEENLYTPVPVSQQEEESSFFFGPEWLKSLGATTMDTPTSSETAPSMPLGVSEPTIIPAEATHQEVSESLAVSEPPVISKASQEEIPPISASSMVATPAAEATPAVESEPIPKTRVESWIAHAAEKLTQPEQNTLTTLEELEQGLRTQGFQPLESGSLSTIAQEEPTLSSALAQFGTFEPQDAPASQPPMPVQPASTPLVSPTKPLWSATPGSVSQSVPSPAANVLPEPATMPPHMAALSNSLSQPELLSSVSASSEPVQEKASSRPVSNVVPSPTPMPAPVLPARPDSPTDIDLEVTMKRPIGQLQPIPPRSPVQQNQSTLKGRPTTSKPTEGDLGYKERLLKGYQLQLAGSYDAAMQEYRIIIRNAPDLLGEVVNNMRALLKLTPKYSAGYRVLGDAYMRQGEYLQAMEAYNQALTMAKKAKR